MIRIVFILMIAFFGSCGSRHEMKCSIAQEIKLSDTRLAPVFDANFDDFVKLFDVLELPYSNEFSDDIGDEIPQEFRHKYLDSLNIDFATSTNKPFRTTGRIDIGNNLIGLVFYSCGEETYNELHEYLFVFDSEGNYISGLQIRDRFNMFDNKTNIRCNIDDNLNLELRKTTCSRELSTDDWDCTDSIFNHKITGNGFEQR